MHDSAPPRTILLPRRAFLSTLVFLLAAMLALPVLADHIGPHRTVTTFKWERLACHYEAVYDPAGPGFFACTLNLYEPPDGSCPSEGDVAGLFNPSSCVGWTDSCTSWPCDIDLDDSIVGCSEGQEGCRSVETTSELPPATVSGSISCGTPGSGGWCRGGGTLSISGDEPLDGESIVSIEGTRNGEAFACAGATCSVALLEGSNAFSFWARSSYGDTSHPGSVNGNLDSAAPSLSGEISGTGGDDGWFISEATMSASASDSGSGLASLELQVDGGGWAAYTAPIVLADGQHTVDLRAADVAGNTAQTSQSVKVDTVDPELSLSAGGSFCPGCGETLEIVLSVGDGGSGVLAWTLTAGGVGVASGNGPASESLAWDGSGLGGGSYTLTLEGRDAAGNASAASRSFDLIVPTAKPDPPTDEPESETQPTSANSGDSTTTSAPSPTADPGAGIASTPAPGSEADLTRTPLTVPFGGLPAAPVAGAGDGGTSGGPAGPLGKVSAVDGDGSSGPLFGAAALALIAGASAVGLNRLRKRQQQLKARREEMAARNAAAEAREGAQRTALAAALAAAAVVEAAERIARRNKVQYRLALNEARLEQFGPTATSLEQQVAWQATRPELVRTQFAATLLGQPVAPAFESSLPLSPDVLWSGQVGGWTPTPTPPVSTPTATSTPVPPTSTPTAPSTPTASTPSATPTPSTTASPSATVDWPPTATQQPEAFSTQFSARATDVSAIKSTSTGLQRTIHAVDNLYLSSTWPRNYQWAGLVSAGLAGGATWRTLHGASREEIYVWQGAEKGASLLWTGLLASNANAQAGLPSGAEIIRQALVGTAAQPSFPGGLQTSNQGVSAAFRNQFEAIGSRALAGSPLTRALQGVGAVGGMVAGGFQISSGVDMYLNDDPRDETLGFVQVLGGGATVAGSAITIGALTGLITVPAVIGAAPVLLGVGAIAGGGAIAYNLLKDQEITRQANRALESWANRPGGFTDTAIQAGRTVVSTVNNVTNAVQDAASTVGSVVDSAVSEVSDFIGGFFGGGSGD